ncbi:MAG: ACP S-malonyltransferase [Planctomycetota bacterium]
MLTVVPPGVTVRGRVAMLFPGVGSENAGMALWLCERSAAARDVMAEASDVSGVDVAALCARPDVPPPGLEPWEAAQLGVLTAGQACRRALLETAGLAPGWCLGHSLGEYTALCAAGVLAFADAVALVRERGRVLRECAARVPGRMAWVVGLDAVVAAEVVEAAAAAGQQVFIGAYDAPDQVTISGRDADLPAVIDELEGRGALVYPLPLRGAFHTPLMEPARQALATTLRSVPMQRPRVTVVANWSGQPYTDARDIAAGLARQLVAPVRWHAALQRLRDAGVHWAIEVGPKNVLGFTARRSAPSFEVRSLDGPAAWEALGAALDPAPAARRRVVAGCLRGVVVSRTPHDVDAARYDATVATPYRVVQARLLAAERAGSPPGAPLMAAAVSMLEGALRTKQVPPARRERTLRAALGGVVVPTMAGTR